MTFNMSKPLAKDLINVLPSTNKIIKTGNGYVTNCIHPNHDDKNPSMGIMDGSSQVIVKCFSNNCSKEELLSYFYERVPYYVEGQKHWDRTKEEWRKKQLRKKEVQNGR